jgi:hypothetical protein
MRGFMGRGVRIGRIGIGALALALAAVPAAAQDAATTNNSASPVAITGPQLRDFNLNGTVTRQATPPPATTPAVRSAPAPQPSATATDAAARTVAERRSSAERRSAPPSAGGTDAAPGPATSAPLQQVDTAPVDAAPAVVTPLPTVTTLPGESAPGPWSLWPWLLAALVAAGGALLLFRRQRQHRGYAAAAGAELAFDVAPQPAPEPVRRAPVAAPPKPASDRIVSTRLRPDIDIELLPERAVVDEQGATIEFQVAVRNNGSAPARDVKVEACMVNAGPAQDQELGAFFAHPDGKGSPIGQIPPMSEVTLKSAVRLPLEHMRQFEIAGRKLFVPIVGLNAVYRGPGGNAQTSASYLVGRDGAGEKMAPFRLDLGPRIFRGLGARQHTASLRT